MAKQDLKIARARLALAAVVTCLFLAAGANGYAQQVSDASDDNLDKRVINVKNQIRKLEEELRQLELKQSARALRENPRAERELVTSGSQLLKSLPADAFPKPGASAQLERVGTLKWIRQNLPGTKVRWAAGITEVRIDGEGPFLVTLVLDQTNEFGDGFNLDKIVYAGLGGAFTLGDTNCQVVLDPMNRVKERLEYGNCTIEEAKRLRRCEGKQVTFEAMVVSKPQAEKAIGSFKKRTIPDFYLSWFDDHEVGFRNGLYQLKKTVGPVKALPIKIVVSPPFVDGFIPREYQELTRVISGQ